MTVSTETTAHSYFPGAAMQPEAIPFQFIDADDVAVTQSDGAALVSGTDYSISGNGRIGQGVITALRSFDITVRIDMRRITKRIQEAVTEAFKPLPADVVGKELDRRALVEQEIDEEVGRSIQLPRGETGLVLPDRDTRASGALGFDSDGGLVIYPTPQQPAAAAEVFSFTATEGQSDFIAAGSSGKPATVSVNGVELTACEDFDREDDAFTITPPCAALDEVTISVSGGFALQLQARAETSSFRQAGVGAQVETVEQALRRFVWVDQYKLVVDADDTNAFNRAKATGAAELLLTDREYRISDEIIFTGIQRLVGKGRQRSFITQTNPTKNGLTFNLSFKQGCGAEKLTIQGAVASQGAGSLGIGLRLVNLNDNASFYQIDVTNFAKGIRVDGCHQALISDFRILYFSDYGLYLSPFTGAGETAGAGNRFQNGKISNFGYTGNNSASLGIWIQQASGEFFNTIDVTTTNVGIKLQATATSYVRYLFMFQVLGDSCLTNNWQIDGAAGTTVANELVQCWSSNSQGDGVSIFGENIDGLYWRGGWMRDCRYNGLSISGGNNIEITAQISRNSAAANNVYHGVLITGADTGTVRILGARIGNVLQTVGTSTQKDNVRIEASFGATIEVSGCDLNDPGAGGLPINLLSATASIDFAGNLPRRSVGTNTSDRYAMSQSSVTTVAAGSTVYIGSAGAQAGVSDSLILPGREAVVAGLKAKVPVAPGVGESFIYTVFKNGVATAMTGSLTGSNVDLDIPPTVGAFLISPTDAVTIKLEASSGAQVTRHNIALVIEP